MIEHFFQCPYCWENISMLLDASTTNETYVEDCEVCCNPIQITANFEAETLLNFDAVNLEQ